MVVEPALPTAGRQVGRHAILRGWWEQSRAGLPNGKGRFDLVAVATYSREHHFKSLFYFLKQAFFVCLCFALLGNWFKRPLGPLLKPHKRTLALGGVCNYSLLTHLTDIPELNVPSNLPKPLLFFTIRLYQELLLLLLLAVHQ